MAAHDRSSMSPMANSGTVLGRAVRVGAEQVRMVRGDQIEAGDVLPTGLALEVSYESALSEVRLEMVGADVHFLDYADEVTVLAQVDRAVLDALSVGTFVARAR